MYNLNYKLRFGVSLDGVYDGSANVYTEDALVEYDAGSGSSRRRFLVPGIQNQLAPVSYTHLGFIRVIQSRICCTYPLLPEC